MSDTADSKVTRAVLEFRQDQAMRGQAQGVRHFDLTGFPDELMQRLQVVAAKTGLTLTQVFVIACENFITFGSIVNNAVHMAAQLVAPEPAVEPASTPAPEPGEDPEAFRQRLQKEAGVGRGPGSAGESEGG